MATKPTTAIVLDLRRSKAKNTYPVKLRVTHIRRQKYYRVDKVLKDEWAVPQLTKSDFEKVMGTKPRGDFKDIQLRYLTIENKAQEIIKGLSEFSFPKFEELLFYKSTNNSNDVFQSFEREIEKLKEQERIKTKSSYECSLNSLKSYSRKKILRFDEITPKFLEGYESWMTNRSNSKTTVGIYLRCLRAIYNNAISDGALSRDNYPFGRNRYVIPNSRKAKRAISKEDLVKIVRHQVPDLSSWEARARDYWYFSYMCNGINVKDMALLKYKNINGDSIIYHRSKISRTTKHDLTPIQAFYLPEMKKIIEHWGNKPASTNTYIFPILNDGMSAIEIQKTIDQTVQNINKNMKKIAQKLGISHTNLTTYVARHTFATMTILSGGSMEYVNQSFNHASLKTTQDYFKGFDKQWQKEFATRLTDFSS